MSKRSKKLSDTSEPLFDGLTFFVDRCLGSIAVPQAIMAAGASVEIHDDHFDQDVDDITWMKFVGRKKWIGLTKDKRIRRHPRERRTALDANGIFFFLAAKSLSGPQQGETIVAHLKAISRLARGIGPPVVGLIRRSQVEVLNVDTGLWTPARKALADEKARRMIKAPRRPKRRE